MIEALVPTRAEANRRRNRCLTRGSDAVMLSAESAVGRHPTAAVAIMDRIIRAIEADRDADSFLPRRPRPRAFNSRRLRRGSATKLLADDLDCPLVVFTRSGSSDANALSDAPERADPRAHAQHRATPGSSRWRGRQCGS